MDKTDYRADERPALDLTQKGELAIKPRLQPRSYQLTDAAKAELKANKKGSK